MEVFTTQNQSQQLSIHQASEKSKKNDTDDGKRETVVCFSLNDHGAVADGRVLQHKEVYNGASSIVRYSIYSSELTLLLGGGLFTSSIERERDPPSFFSAVVSRAFVPPFFQRWLVL
jgi:hypothetical protein